ncbi:hypothetical protein B738_28917 [Photorhabdus temperata subsp. temperata M1021]|nr:hypothetical protein B738_28917 [Photorhabdus temperata subsp. temperata M1021]
MLVRKSQFPTRGFPALNVDFRVINKIAGRPTINFTVEPGFLVRVTVQNPAELDRQILAFAPILNRLIQPAIVWV